MKSGVPSDNDSFCVMPVLYVELWRIVGSPRLVLRLFCRDSYKRRNEIWIE